MNKNLFWLFLLTLICCQPPVDNPTLRELKSEYQFRENKYAIIVDSIVNFRTSEKLYQLEILKDSSRVIAFWKEQLPISNNDSTNLESLLSPEYEAGFTAEFLLQESGEIDSLMNWPKLKEFVDSLTTEYYEQAGYSSDDIKKIRPYLKAKQSKERLANNNFKAISAYHNFYAIDATINDTLVQNEFSIDMNGITYICDASISINRPNDYLVDYVMTYNYDGDMDLELVSELQNLTSNSNLDEMKSVHLRDTVFYRYNLNLEQLIDVVFKRHLFFDSLRTVHEIELSIR